MDDAQGCNRRDRGGLEMSTDILKLLKIVRKEQPQTRLESFEEEEK